MICRDWSCDREARVGRTRCWQCGYDVDTPRLPHLPAAPLVALVEARGGVAECGAQPATKRAYTKAKERGTITVWAADTLALKLLGVHPCEVWEKWWGESDASSHEHETVAS